MEHVLSSQIFVPCVLTRNFACHFGQAIWIFELPNHWIYLPWATWHLTLNPNWSQGAACGMKQPSHSLYHRSYVGIGSVDCSSLLSFLFCLDFFANSFSCSSPFTCVLLGKDVKLPWSYLSQRYFVSLHKFRTVASNCLVERQIICMNVTYVMIWPVSGDEHYLFCYCWLRLGL